MNIEWKTYFQEKILQRGKAYFKNASVSDVTKTSYGYSALVSGSYLYTVYIEMDDKKGIAGMACGCSYAGKGHYCKHMAAVLYDLESKGALGSSRDDEKSEREVFPFSRSTGENPGKNSGGDSDKRDSYRFYNMEQIAEDIIIYDDVQNEARRLINENLVEMTNVTEGYVRSVYGLYNDRMIKAEGFFTEKNGKKAYITVKASRDRILYMECNAKDCDFGTSTPYYYYNEARSTVCAHITALLLLLAEYIEKINPGDATSRGAQLLLDRYRSKRGAGRKAIAEGLDFGEKKPDITLEPRFDVDEYGDFAVSFRIGRNKLYVVKNIPEMQKAFEHESEMKLGKRESIDFAAETFSSDSEKVYTFISRELKGELLRGDNAYLFSGYNRVSVEENIKGSMGLYGKRLDDFFELFKDRKIPYTAKEGSYRRTGETILTDGVPKVHLYIDSISNDNGEFDGISLSGNLPKMINGIDSQYYFDGTALNRAGNDELEILDILGDGESGGKINLEIGRKNMSEFCYRVLPALKEFADVEIHEPELIEKYLYPEAAFEFYLDAEDDNVTCSVKVKYGERECELYRAGNENQSAEVFRDLQREKEIEEIVEDLFPYIFEEDGVRHCAADEDLIYSIIDGGVDALVQLGEVHATDRFRGLTIRRKPKITVGVKIESDLLNLSITSDGLTEEDLLDLLNSYRKKKKYHRLKNGDFMTVDEDTLDELSSMLDIMHVSPSEFVKGKMQLPMYRALYLDRMLEKNDAIYAQRDKHFKSLIRNFKTVGDSDYELPESLDGVMRNYQQFGYKWLRTVASCGFGGILADDMGLGKTLQVIAVLLAAKQENEKSAGTSLVVTPASLVYNWREEFAKFAPQLDICVITGTKSERADKLAGYKKHDVLITSYDLIKRDILEYEDKAFEYQIIDEAQFIKNHTTAAAKAVKVVKSKVRFALTGTPIENRLSELWSIFDYLMPGFLYTYDRFRRELENPIVKERNEAAMSQLKRMAEPFILRRLKGDVLRDLPEKIEEVQYVVFEKTQHQLYDAQALHMKKMLEEQNDESFAKSKIKILAEITRIRQICCDPSLCFENYKGESAKRDACMELVRSAIDGEHRMLIFSQFTSMLELLESDLQKEKIPYFKITGATKKEERIDLVHRFNEGDTPVFLISLKAGGTGLNLTGADIVLHYDPWWNLAAQNQATDRAHRIGQEKTVSVYKLIVKGSIEEKILKLQEDKKALADEILNGETGGLMTMSRDELIALL